MNCAMSPSLPRLRLALCLLAVLLTVSRLGAQEAIDAQDHAAARYWPQWRGPLATGEAPHADPPQRWSEGENVAFKVEIPGQGNATPVVWGERVYVLTAVPGEAVEQPRQLADPEGRERHPMVNAADHRLRFTVLALDRRDGRVLWQRVVREEVPHDGTHQDGSFAAASPVTDGERIYASFGSRGLYALDTDGNVLWERDFGDMVVRRGFGEGSSPALAGDRLLILWDHEGPSFLAALDKRTGQELWRVDRDEITSWTTPLVAALADRHQVITAATHRVRSYDLDTGGLIWEAEGMTLNAIPSPVAAAGLVYLTSGFRTSIVRAIRLAEARGEVSGPPALAWSIDRDTPYVPSPLLYRDTLYLIKSNSGILNAIDTATGASRFLERLDGIANVYASPVAAAGRIYIASREGATAVLAHGPKLEVLAVNQLDDGFDASPALVDGELFLRGRRHLYKIAGATR